MLSNLVQDHLIRQEVAVVAKRKDFGRLDKLKSMTMRNGDPPEKYSKGVIDFGVKTSYMSMINRLI